LSTNGPWGKANKEHLHEAEIWANQQVYEAFGSQRMVYNVWAIGGTTMGGEHYGGWNYRVDLAKAKCTCNIPQIMHALLSHYNGMHED